MPLRDELSNTDCTHVQGSGRHEVSQVFGEGSSLRKEPFWILSKGSPQIPQFSVFLEVLL